MPEDDVRHPREIYAAVRNFRPAAWARLRMLAKIHSRGWAIEADDLVQEAITRALTGARKCPTDVEIIPFLAESMRSIASNEKKKRSELISESFGKGDDQAMNPVEHFMDPAASAEEHLLAKEEIDRLFALFVDDTDAYKLLEGMADGLKGVLLRTYSGLGKLDYERKRAIIRYRINKHYAEGESK